MRTCPECNQVMTWTELGGGPIPDDAIGIEYVCQCGVRCPGTPMDAMVRQESSGSTQVLKSFERLMRVAARDPTNAKIQIKCPTCALPFMTMVRLSEHEIVVFLCDCGYNSSAPGAKRPAALDQPLGLLGKKEKGF
jgi:hypothetical protein